MKYSELEDSAKDRARNKWRETECVEEWWEDVYNNAAAIAATLGIDIGEQCNRTVKGKQIKTPDIQFRGFWSQGDGASFAGILHVTRMNGCLDKLKAHVGKLTEEDTLHRMAVFAQEIYNKVVVHWTANRLSVAPSDEWEAPECTPTMAVSIQNHFKGFSTNIDDEEVACAIADDMNKLVSDFADWIYEQLEEEHDHFTSDEAVEASIEANDPNFDEDGNLL